MRINPEHMLALNNMAALHCKMGKYTKAQECCEKALNVDPNHAMSHRNLAKILDTLGDTRAAVRHNRIAIQLGPGVLQTQESLSKGHEQFGLPAPTHADTMTYRNLSRQLVARGMTQEGHANAHYDQYRALGKKVNVLPNSEKTKEVLIKSKTKV